MSSMLIRKYFFAVCLLMVSIPSIAQTAYLQPMEINEGDTTKLIIEVEGGTPSLHGLDTSGLEKDFEILGTSSGVQSVLNQNTKTYQARWEIELFPLRSGELTIPPLDINGRKTEPLVLNVKKLDGSGATSGQNVFIKISAEPENPYIGQQINITVRLYHNIRIVNGTLSEPEAASADIYRVGNDISYSESISNKEYNVLERSFAMFANNTGELPIFPVSFRGQIEDQSDDSSSALSTFMRQIRQIKRSSNELSLNVREIPSSYSGKYWLPANDLRLTEQWSDQGAQLQVGDSVSREIKLLADGLPGESLPEKIMDSNNNDLNIYPDKVSRNNQDIGKKLVGRVEQKYALIMSKAGYLDVPQLTIKWWDVDEDVEKEATLPPKTLIVAGDSIQTTSSQNQSDSLTQSTVSNIAPDSTKVQTNYWQWMALLFLALWLLTMGFWFRSRLGEAETEQISIESAWNQKAFEQACHSNNAVQARNQLIAWAADTWPEDKITGLYQLKSKIHEQNFSAELNKLDAVLFSGNKLEWSGQDLFNAFVNAHSGILNKQNQANEIIPPLYAK